MAERDTKEHDTLSIVNSDSDAPPPAYTTTMKTLMIESRRYPGRIYSVGQEEGWKGAMYEVRRATIVGTSGQVNLQFITHYHSNAINNKNAKETHNTKEIKENYHNDPIRGNIDYILERFNGPAGTGNTLSHSRILSPLDFIEGYKGPGPSPHRSPPDGWIENTYDILVFESLETKTKETEVQNKADLEVGKQVGGKGGVVELSLLEFVILHGKLSERRTRKISEQVLDALGYLHANGVVHRETNPDNLPPLLQPHDDLIPPKDLNLYNIILLSSSKDWKDTRVKIILDPRLACAYDPTGQTLLSLAVGTSYFPAPELIPADTWKVRYLQLQGGERQQAKEGKQKEEQNQQEEQQEKGDDNTGISYIGPEIDIWNLGITLFTLLVGRVPFDAEDMEELHNQVRKGDLHWPGGQGWHRFWPWNRNSGGSSSASTSLGSGSGSWFSSWSVHWGKGQANGGVSNECKDLINSMLATDRTKRATLVRVCEHPWIRAGEGDA